VCKVSIHFDVVCVYVCPRDDLSNGRGERDRGGCFMRLGLGLGLGLG
jgi:hypothetical protein